MYAEDLRRDNGSDREAVENVYEGLPRLDITPSLALVIKPVYCVKRVRTVCLIWIMKHHLVLR